ncbi:hypothetical protein N7532_007274 [Penicillium argentinense]|uniref:Carboxylic ester hydrolase n=1 Tax=Penicillium argentinense TaxID=1131581 RepID=A0A9W9F7D5_9EURO|nr:uncharacterized protein N7532_007274 [Penicillium argentinense]KAJ5094983.1 hypothetical protein N7532_007274 [Penicillium argentinense]
MRLTIALYLVKASISLATPTSGGSETATVEIPFATILGSISNNVETFAGIPYAEPPTGSNRLRPPTRLTKSLGIFDATGTAAACPQFLASPDSTDFLQKILGSVANIPFVNNATDQSEDCLTITVARPEGTTADSRLPVLFWIYGGAFEIGWSSMYDGTNLINYGVNIGKPFIFVAVNYRIGGFGFLAGKEILKDGAANLGLLDQRMGLEWVADNIATFGGDPDKVTIWGESAGAISVLDHMVLYEGNNTYNGKSLFHGGIMDSGSITPTEPVDSQRAQDVYDIVVEAGGCRNASSTLDCLRGLEYEDYLNAACSPPGLLSYSGVALSYLPRPDGRILAKSPDVLVQQGKYAPVPFIIGDQEDEGTLFSLFQSNVSNSKDLVGYLKNVMFPRATEEQLTTLVSTYGSGISAVTKGSPFGSGMFNEVFPGFKQRAAVIGDILFTLARRTFLQLSSQLRPEVPSWSYLATYDKGTPILGTFHTSDIIQVFFGTYDNYAAHSVRTYYLNFLYFLDPNADLNGTYPTWPRWGKSKDLLSLAADKATVVKDDFRESSYEVIRKVGNVLRL